MSDDPWRLLGWSVRLYCAGIALHSLELAWNWRELRDGHLLGWHGDGRGPGAIRKLLQRTQGFPVSWLLLVGRASIAAFCCVGTVGTWPTTAGLMLLFCSQLYYNVRFQIVLTNADYLNLTGLAGAAIGLIPGASRELCVVALGFLSFQALLAYFATGVDKLLSSNWRNGTRLVQIFQDSSHRFPLLGELFATRVGLSRFVTWAIITGELLFPASLLLPEPLFIAVLLAGAGFHAAIAVTMALPMFFWPCVATYPALYFFHSWLRAEF